MSRLPRFLPGSGVASSAPEPIPPGGPSPVADLAVAFTTHASMKIGWNSGTAGAAPDHFRLVVQNSLGAVVQDETSLVNNFTPSQIPGRTWGDFGFGSFGPRPLTLTVYAIANGFNSAGRAIQSPAGW